MSKRYPNGSKEISKCYLKGMSWRGSSASVCDTKFYELLCEKCDEYVCFNHSNSSKFMTYICDQCIATTANSQPSDVIEDAKRIYLTTTKVCRQ